MYGSQESLVSDVAYFVLYIDFPDVGRQTVDDVQVLIEVYLYDVSFVLPDDVVDKRNEVTGEIKAVWL
jgi:hypothetical protein